MAKSKSFNNITDDIRFQATNTATPQVPAQPSDGYVSLSARSIVPSPFNEGLDMEKIEEYVASMKTTGLLEPIVVYDLGDGKYEILSGHQRFHAWCNVLKHRDIKAVVLPYETDPVKRFIAHTEANTLSRNKDLKFWLSRIKHARSVLSSIGFAGTRAEEFQQLSKMLNGISQTQLYRYDSFNKLIPELQAFESKGYLSANTLYYAVSLDEKQQLDLCSRMELLQKERKERNPEILDDFEITREEFVKLVSDVRTGKAQTSVPRRHYSSYQEKVDKSYNSFLKSLTRTKTKEDRTEALEYINKLRKELDKIESDLS